MLPVQQGWLRLPQGGWVAQVPDWQVPVVQGLPMAQQGRPITPQVGGVMHVPDTQVPVVHRPPAQQGRGITPQVGAGGVAHTPDWQV